MKIKPPKFTSTAALWGVYVALLLVLLPHTQWAFEVFEPRTIWGTAVAWFAAIAFEFAIAVLTYKLAKHIEVVPNHKDAKRRFAKRYVNAYAAGLVVAIAVSALANLAHAVEFGQYMAIFAGWPWGFGVYVAAFGAILPLTSLVFARVLSNVVDAEQETDQEVTTLRYQLAEAEKRVKKAEAILPVMEGPKADRIKAAIQLWPNLQASGVAQITDASPSYVSEILSGNGRRTGEKERTV